MDEEVVDRIDDGTLNDENNFIVDNNSNNAQSAVDSESLKLIEGNVFFCGRDLNITKSQLYIISLLCPYFFLTSSYYSLFAPFFPNEALKKGISQTQVGLIFGIFQLAFLLLAPIFGKYVINSLHSLIFTFKKYMVIFFR